MKMTAAVLRTQGLPRPYAVSKPMTIEQVDLDPPGPGEVLYQIIGAGLCHSDLSTIENLRPRKLPSIPGHEAAGIVVEVGAGVTAFKPGDHVVSVFVSSCGDCRVLQQCAAKSVHEQFHRAGRGHADLGRAAAAAEWGVAAPLQRPVGVRAVCGGDGERADPHR